jgi:hypothetical protein
VHHTVAGGDEQMGTCIPTSLWFCRDETGLGAIGMLGVDGFEEATIRVSMQLRR